jgi:hypothetical protein
MGEAGEFDMVYQDCMPSLEKPCVLSGDIDFARTWSSEILYKLAGDNR